MKAGSFAALSLAATIGGCLLDTASYAQQPVYQMRNGAPCQPRAKTVIYWGRARVENVFVCQQPNGAWLEVSPAAVVARAPQAVQQAAPTQPYYAAQRQAPPQQAYAGQRQAPPPQAYAAPTDPLTKTVDDVLMADSRTWVWNHYMAHSARNARVLSRSPDNRDSEIYGDYTLNGSQTGWLKIEFVDGQISCLTFYDFPHTCRALGHSPGQVIAAGAIVGIVAAASSSGSSGGSAGSCDQETGHGCSQSQIDDINHQRDMQEGARFQLRQRQIDQDFKERHPESN